MRSRTRPNDDRFGSEPAQPLGGQPAPPPDPVLGRGMLDVVRGIGLGLLLRIEAWAARRRGAEEAAMVFLSPLEERIQFSERLTAILLMIPSAGTAVLTYYGVGGPLTETGSTAIQKGQAVGFALAIGVFVWLGWFYLFGLIHRLDGARLRNALLAGTVMVATIAVIDAPFNMLALAGGPAAQMSLVAMAHAYPTLQHPAPRGFGPGPGRGSDVAELMTTKARQNVHARAIKRLTAVNSIKANLQNALVRNRPQQRQEQERMPANDLQHKNKQRQGSP